MFTIIGNPPYIGKGEKFYLKVMSECEKFADSAVWLVPTDFVDNHRIKENINNKHISILNERFESFSRIETVVGDAKFDDAEFFSDVGIFKTRSNLTFMTSDSTDFRILRNIRKLQR